MDDHIGQQTSSVALIHGGWPPPNGLLLPASCSASFQEDTSRLQLSSVPLNPALTYSHLSHWTFM